MTDATILAIVTIICTMITTSIGLLVRSNVLTMKTIIEAQTIELAGLHQLVIAQSAKIYSEEATKKGAGRQPHKLPPDEPYTANTPYKRE